MHYFTLEQRETLQRTLEQRAHELRAVEQALARLHEPEFGICQDCRSEIPFARLLATPFATRCIACQADFERKRRPAKAA